MTNPFDPWGRKHRTPEEAFEARTMPEPNTGCLLWLGGTRRGYGQIWVRGRDIGAHRYAWERYYKEVPKGYHVDHKCHTKLCVNIDHLRLATRSENASNRRGATRANSKSGIRNVYLNKKGLWYVKITKEGKRNYLGQFPSKEEAAEVAERGRRELFGEYAGGT